MNIKRMQELLAKHGYIYGEDAAENALIGYEIAQMDEQTNAASKDTQDDSFISGGEGYWNEEGSIFTAPIDIGDWGARIECHGVNEADAYKLRDRVLYKGIPQAHAMPSQQDGVPEAVEDLSQNTRHGPHPMTAVEFLEMLNCIEWYEEDPR